MKTAGTRCKPMALLACLITGLVVAASTSAAEFAGQRLFTTAEQRTQLDAMRARMDGDVDDDEELLSAAGVAITDDDTEVEPESESPVGVRGFVQRSGGPPALWLDDDSDIDTDRGRIEGREVVITLPDGRTVRLKPGQVYDPASGEVKDAFKR